MTAEFTQKVREMREAQKEYFRTRQKSWLYKSKDLEKDVDYMIRHFEEGGQA